MFDGSSGENNLSRHRITIEHAIPDVQRVAYGGRVDHPF